MGTAVCGEVICLVFAKTHLMRQINYLRITTLQKKKLCYDKSIGLIQEFSVLFGNKYWEKGNIEEYML